MNFSCPSINKALSAKPAVKEFPNATYLEKSAEPAVKGEPSDELVNYRSSSLLHAAKVNETNSSHLKFFIMILYYYFNMILWIDCYRGKPLLADCSCSDYLDIVFSE